MRWDLVLWARDQPIPAVETDKTKKASEAAANHVLVAIATHANKAGRAWPSIETLAEETQLHRGTVYRAVRRIEQSGLIDVIHRPGRSCEYLFPHPARSATPTPRDLRHHPARSATNPARSATHKEVEEVIENGAPPHDRAGAAVETEPVDVRALIDGVLPGWTKKYRGDGGG